MQASRDAATELVTRTAEETRTLAARLASVARPGDVLCLWGELGAGKTVFAKGFGAGLGVADTISSPTFVLMGEYAGRLPLFHIDLYRLDSAEQALDGGLLDDRQSTGVVLVEWPDRLGDSLPSDRLDVQIDADVGAGAAAGAGEGSDAAAPRTIRLAPHGPGHERYIEAAR